MNLFNLLQGTEPSRLFSPSPFNGVGRTSITVNSKAVHNNFVFALIYSDSIAIFLLLSVFEKQDDFVKFSVTADGTEAEPVRCCTPTFFMWMLQSCIMHRALLFTVPRSSQIRDREETHPPARQQSLQCSKRRRQTLLYQSQSDGGWYKLISELPQKTFR